MVATEQENAAYVDSLWQKYRRQRTIDTRNQLAEYYLPLVERERLDGVERLSDVTGE